jgi:hypothetical protein
MQNIKGTGLGFVYRWLSVDRVHDLLVRLERDAERREEILGELATYPGYGLVDARLALHRLRDCAASVDPSWEPVRGTLQALLTRLEALEQQFAAALESTGAVSLTHRALNKVERWLEPLDAMARKWRATRIYRDLIDERVGHTRAAELMRDVTNRGKGGWLAKWWESLRK